MTERQHPSVRHFAILVANALGSDHWTTTSGHHAELDAFLHGPERELIHLRAGEGSDEGRLSISGSLPDDLHAHRPSGWKHCVITVSTSKGALTVANEIRRRLLPSYKPLLAEALSSKRSSDVHTVERDKLASEILHALGKALRSRVDEVTFGTYGSGIYGAVDVPFGDSEAVFTINIPNRRAVAFAGVLAEFRAAYPEDVQ